MSAVQLTEDVFDIAIDTIDKEIHRLTKTKEGLQQIKRLLDEPQITGGGDVSQIAIHLPPDPPAAASQRRRRKKPGRKVKEATPAKKARSGKTRYTASLADIERALEGVRGLTPFKLQEALKSVGVSVTDAALAKVLTKGQELGRLVLDDNGKWGLAKEEQ